MIITTDFFPISQNLEVAQKRTQIGQDWNSAHKKIQSAGQRMLVLPDLVEVLKYTQKNMQKVYEEITGVQSAFWQAGWIDARFEQKEGELFLNTNHTLDSDKNLIACTTELLDRDTLMEDGQISLEDWLQHPTSQGLPRKDVQSGDLYYFHPRNRAVIAFAGSCYRVGLYCHRDPSDGGSSFGVRAAKKRD